MCTLLQRTMHSYYSHDCPPSYTVDCDLMLTTAMCCRRFSAPSTNESLERRWRDGSLELDLPTFFLAEMFNCNHFIVSQTNPHIVPLLNIKKSLSRKWANLFELELRHRWVTCGTAARCNSLTNITMDKNRYSPGPCEPICRLSNVCLFYRPSVCHAS